MSKSRVVLSLLSLVVLSSLSLTTLARADVGEEMEAEERSGDVGEQMKAEEAERDAEEAAGAPRETARSKQARSRQRATPRRATRANDDRFGAPTGPTGAGLSLSPAQRARAWGELGFHAQDGLAVWVPIVVGGYKLTEHLELEIILPFAYGLRDVPVGTTELETRGTFVSGDPFFGLHYLLGADRLRLKAGGGFAFPFGPDGETGEYLALTSATKTRGLLDNYLWAPRALSMVALTRVEYGGPLFVSTDAWFAILLPTNGGETHQALTLAPGLGYWLSQNTLLGARFGLHWMMTETGDNAQLSIEPYFRHHLGKPFLQARVTLNLDEPAGSFLSTNSFWGAYLGGGISF